VREEPKSTGSAPDAIFEAATSAPEAPARVEGLPMAGPAPLHGGVFTLLTFMRRNHMFGPRYFRMFGRLAWHKLFKRRAYGKKIHLNGIAFLGRRLKIEIGPLANLYLGRWCWIGNGTKIRVHGGEVRIGSKSVLGEEITFSAYEHISVGRECVIADRVMFIDFDHKVEDVEQAIRKQGVYSEPVRIGNNVWIGYGASILRGVTVGDNCIIGTHAVVTKDVPDNAIVGGVPARVIRMREAPRTLRWL
jgi:acetyltransferase-like isoleucine patch superfamily enzyme